MKRFIHSTSGTAVIEFALILPVLVYLLIGMIEVGRYAYYGILAAHAVRSGLQYGTQNVMSAADTTGIRTVTLADAQNAPAFNVTTTYFCELDNVAANCTSNATGLVYFLKIQVTGTFTSLLNYPGVPNHIPITSSGVMRVANQ